jgi:hypothetical protein
MNSLATFVGTVGNLIKGIRTLAIPRLEDLPYWTSPPIQFVYESEASLTAGSYEWSDAASPLTPDRPILTNALYYFRNISLAADIAELDYTGAIVTTPQFFTFLKSDAKSVLFREGITMNKFFENFDYRLVWSTQSGQEQLFAAFRGALLQTPALLGKSSITLKAIISAQEIIDDNYVRSFKAQYPGAVS